MVFFHKDAKRASFVLRMRLPAVAGGKSERFSEVFGKWDDPKIIGKDAFSAKRARVEYIIRRAKYEQQGVKVEARAIPTLLDAIEEYIVARRDKRDPRTAKKGAPLPTSWGHTGLQKDGSYEKETRDGHIGRFMSMCEKYLARPCNVLNYDTLLEARNQYAESRRDGTSLEQELKRVRSIITTIMPMLTWFKKVKYLTDGEGIEDLKPARYPPNTRFLYPGEIQKATPLFHELPHLGGLLPLFVRATGVRAETALGMEWDECAWGQFETFKDFDGHEQRFLTWIVPRRVGRMKGRGKSADEDTPRRVLLTGDSLRILERLREAWERRKDENDNRVFSKKTCNMWRARRSKVQRAIEKQMGTPKKARWNRYTLRKTHSTYLSYLQCPKHLVSMSLTHTPSSDGAADVTAVHYDHSDAMRAVSGDMHDPLVQLGPWHIRLHKLFRDMETGDTRGDLGRIQPALRTGDKSSNMRDRYAVDVKLIDVEKLTTPLRVVA
jgi:integrase